MFHARVCFHARVQYISGYWFVSPLSAAPFAYGNRVLKSLRERELDNTVSPLTEMKWLAINQQVMGASTKVVSLRIWPIFEFSGLFPLQHQFKHP